jgi:hypothetical protein
MKLTRVRIEASALPSEGKEALERFLIEEATSIRDEQGGTWSEESGGAITFTAKDGWWGRLTIRRES